jgi:hypothetical protein
MRRPSLLAGIGFALVVGVFAGPVWWGAKTALPYFWAIRFAVVVSYCAYCLYLILAARSRVGTLSLSAVNLAIVTGLFVLPTSNSLAVGAATALITINRSLLFHRSLVAIAFDGLVSAIGLSFAGYLFATSGSVPVAVWSFFLAQSVFALIPPRFSEGNALFSTGNGETVDSFQRSQRQAETALQRLARQDYD